MSVTLSDSDSTPSTASSPARVSASAARSPEAPIEAMSSPRRDSPATSSDSSTPVGVTTSHRPEAVLPPSATGVHSTR